MLPWWPVRCFVSVVAQGRWCVPHCPVGAACPAFLCLTFTEVMWQLFAPLPKACFDPSFFPAPPLLHSQSRFLPSVTSGVFQGVELPFKSFASPLVEAVGSPRLLWSHWAAAAMQHGSVPEQQEACAGSVRFLFAL